MCPARAGKKRGRRAKFDREPVIVDHRGMKTRAPRKLRKRHDKGELRAVVDETIGLFHRLRWVAERIYGMFVANGVVKGASAQTR